MFIVEIQTKIQELIEVCVHHSHLVNFLIMLEDSDPVKAYKVIDSSEGIIGDLKHRFNLGHMDKFKTRFDWN